MRVWSQGWARELTKATPKGVTGNLRRLWRWTLFEKGAVVENPATYGPFVEDGTGLYGPFHQRIFPRTAKALHWHSARGISAFSAGAAVRAKYEATGLFRRSTRGMRGRHMFGNTLAAHPPRTEFPPIMMESLARAFLVGPEGAGG